MTMFNTMIPAIINNVSVIHFCSPYTLFHLLFEFILFL